MCGNIVLYALLAGTHTHIRVGMYTCETCMHARNLFMLTKHTSWLYMKVMGNVPENTPVWFLIYPSCTDPHCDWSMSIPGGHAKPMGVCVIAPGDGVACGGKFKRGCVSCCPSAEASINMIPIVLASVLIASGKNIWHSLILCVIVSVCLQVCLCEWVSMPAHFHTGSLHCAVPYWKEKLCSLCLMWESNLFSCLTNTPCLTSIT